MAMTGRLDVVLVEASLQGDREAFGEIVDRYRALVASIAYSATGDLEATQDLAQDVFVEAWCSLPGLREPAKLGPWLAGIARNLVKGFRRQGARTPTVGGEVFAGVMEMAATAAANPREQAISREEQDLLWHTLEGIPEMYREPLIMYYWEGMSGEAVARALAIGEEATRVRLHRGRAMLRERVRESVENSLAKTTPGKTLTVAVLAALPAAHAEAALAAGGTAGTALSAAKVAGSAATGFLPWLLLVVHGAAVNVADTFSRRERRFVLWATLASVAAAAAGFVVLRNVVYRVSEGAIPFGAAGWVMGLTAAALVGVMAAVVLYSLRHQREIRKEDGTYVDAMRSARPSHLGMLGAARIHLSCAGYVLGGLAWLIAWTWWRGQWGLLCLAIGVGSSLHVWATARSVRRPALFLGTMRVVIVVMACCALAALNLLVARGMPRLSPDFTESPGTPTWAARVPLNVLVVGFYLVLYQRVAWVQRRSVTQAAVQSPDIPPRTRGKPV
jgi:RNA polymerase sigma factor (sigma-70 family)